MSRNVGRIRQLQIVTPEEELENLRNEVGALKRTVESKSAAVNILRAELQECQKERDKFRTLVEDETLHRSSVSSASKKAAYSDPCRSAMLSGSEGTLAQLLSLSKEENKTLRLESTELRCKLHDAQADIKVLREETQRLKGAEGRRRSLAHTATSQLAHQEREQFISQMEALSSKCQALEGDVRGLIEEREELVRELDASSHKLHRLNYMLNTILSSTSTSALNHPKRLIDLDAIITENRYLQERLKQTEEEKNLARSNALKYKAALEKSRTQGSIKLGTSDNLIVTPKQVAELLRDYRGEVDGAAETDLKSLCVALVDALNQRSRALRTQRSANKVLVTRVTELERRLSSSGNPEEPNTGSVGAETTTSHITSLGLMEGYVPPSGPIPKVSEETVLKDPRLVKLLSSATKGGTTEDTDVNSKEENIGCLSRSESEDGAFNNSSLKTSNDSVASTDSKTTTESSQGIAENTSAIPREKCKMQNTGTPEYKNNKKLVHECPANEPSRNVLKTCSENERTSANKENHSCQQVNEVCDKASSQINNLESQTVSVSEDIKDQTTKHKKVSTYVNPEDELEEIVPIDQLDLYIKEIQERRKASNTSALANCEVNVTKQDASDPSKTDSAVENVQDVHDIEKESLSPTSEKEDQDDDSSFDLDISDYDSDNDNLDLALQDWQNDVDKNYNGKKEKKRKSGRSKESKQKGASGKEKFGFWQKDSTAETKIHPALKEFLDKATAAAVDNGVDMP